jgi:toxin secretion/phage lysis holin
MQEVKTKSIFASFVAVSTFMFNAFDELVVILIFCMIIDYITGILAAYHNNNLQSSIGLLGIFKKFGLMVLVALSFMLDYIICVMLVKINITLPFNGTFGFATTIWLIGNEGVSIVENLGTMGVPIPPFLREGFRRLKKKGDDKDDKNSN